MTPLEPPSLRPWRAVRSEKVGAFRVLDVVRDELVDADGKARGDAYVIHCRDWCNVVAVTPEDELVLVWQYRFGTRTMSLEIPGGVVDPGETAAEAARRELREETGYEAESFELLYVIAPNPALQNNRCHTFLARGARRTQGTELDAQEELETTLVPASELEALLDGGQVTHALVQSALELYARRRRSGGRPGTVEAR